MAESLVDLVGIELEPLRGREPAVRTGARWRNPERSEGPNESLVDLVGIEPTTSSMPWKRAPSCATGPHFGGTPAISGHSLIFSHQRFLVKLTSEDATTAIELAYATTTIPRRFLDPRKSNPSSN